MDVSLTISQYTIQNVAALVIKFTLLNWSDTLTKRNDNMK